MPQFVLLDTRAFVESSLLRTADDVSEVQERSGFRGIRLFAIVTEASGMGQMLNIKVQCQDPLSGLFIDMEGAEFPTITSPGSHMLTIYPGITEVKNIAISTVMSRAWRVVAEIAGQTPSFTYAVSAEYII